MTVWIETELCNGCKRCIKACPYGAVELKDGKAHVENAEIKEIGCNQDAADTCPVEAIDIKEE